MSTYNIGYFIRIRRTELNISQEELCEGICSTVTLSRIETCRQMPNKNHLQMLLQRLGYSDSPFLGVASELDYKIQQAKFKARQAYIDRDYAAARELLEKFRELAWPEHCVADRQFYEGENASLLEQEGKISNSETLERLENALRLTCPHYDRNNLPKLMTFEEILILNNIAIRIDSGNNRNLAIKMYYHLKDFYDKNVVDIEESLRAKPLILYNLSKLLGLSGRYDECIEVCNQGINLAKQTGRASMLALTLYNLAWALVKRGDIWDIEPAKRYAKEAYYMSLIVPHSPTLPKRLEDFFIDYFNESPPLL